jgi:hypothetical protein
MIALHVMAEVKATETATSSELSKGVQVGGIKVRSPEEARNYREQGFLTEEEAHEAENRLQQNQEQTPKERLWERIRRKFQL